MKTNEPLMLLPEYNLDGLGCTLACVKVMNIAILTDADIRNTMRRLCLPHIKQPFYANGFHNQAEH